MVVKGNATSDACLHAAGIGRAAGIVTCISSDADNLFVTLAARELASGIHIVARGDEPSVEDRMLRAGADTVVYPLKLGGEQIATLIAQQLGKTGQAAALSEAPGVQGYYLRVYRHFDESGVTVEEVLKQTAALQAVSLKKENEESIEEPPGEVLVARGDSLVLLVNEAREPIADASRSGHARLEWSDEMSVGIVSFDEEHKHILDLINRLEDALAGEHGREVLSNIFDTMIDYTVTHFENEEAYFDKHDYPEKEAHINEHRELTKKVLDLNREKRYVFPDNVSEFLRAWIRDHIRKIDKRYGDYLNKKGVW